MAIRINILTQLDNRELKRAQRELGQIGKNITRTFDVAIAGAVAGVAVGLAKSTKAAMEDAKSQALLARQIKNTTGASDEQIKAVEDSISKMQLMSSVADDEIRPAFAALVRSTGDVGKATSLTGLALDVAAGTGKNLSAVSLALGKAVNGSSTALVKLVPSIKGASDPLAVLQQQFSGAAETAANADPYKRLGIIFDEIQEQIGAQLLPVLQEFANYLASTEGQKEVAQFVDIFKNIALQAANALRFVAENKDAIIAFGKAALTIYGLVKVYEGLQIAIKAAGVAQAFLSGSMVATPWGAIAVAMGAVVIAGGAIADAMHKAYLETEGVRTATENLSKSATIGGETVGAGRAAQGGAFVNRNTQATKAVDKLKAETKKLSDAQKQLGEAYLASNPPVTEASKNAQKLQEELAKLFQQKEKDTKSTKANTATTTANKKAQGANSAARIKYWQGVKAAAEALKAEQDALAEAQKQLRASATDINSLMSTTDIGEFESRVVSAFDNIRSSIKSVVESGSISAAAGQSLTAYADSTAKAIGAIAKQRDELLKKKSLVEALYGDVKGSLMGAGALTGLLEKTSQQVTKTVTSIVNGLQVAVSSTTEEITSGNLISNFKAILDKTKKFAEQLKTLRKLGLDKNLFAEIVNAGADAGGALAQEIISGGADAVKELNTAYADLATVSGQIAEQTAVVMYNDGKDVAGGLVAGLLAQEEALKSAAETLANAFISTFNSLIAGLVIPSQSLSSPYPEINAYIKGATEGLTGQALTNQINMLSGADVSAPGSFRNVASNVNITVNAGVGTNGKAVGQAILTEVNRYKAANGGSL